MSLCVEHALTLSPTYIFSSLFGIFMLHYVKGMRRLSSLRTHSRAGRQRPLKNLYEKERKSAGSISSFFSKII